MFGLSSSRSKPVLPDISTEEQGLPLLAPLSPKLNSPTRTTTPAPLPPTPTLTPKSTSDPEKLPSIIITPPDCPSDFAIAFFTPTSEKPSCRYGSFFVNRVRAAVLMAVPVALIALHLVIVQHDQDKERGGNGWGWIDIGMGCNGSHNGTVSV